MGCSASEVKTIEQLKRPSSNITESFTELRKPPQLSTIKDEQSTSTFSPQELVASFNRYNFKTGKGIQLNTSNTLLLSITHQSPTPQIITKQEHYFTSLNEVNILNTTKSPYSIDNNDNYLNLQATFKSNSYPINTSLSFKFIIPQIFFKEYSFEIKLLNINTSSYDTYQFNQLDRPIMFLFFDILSHEAIEKVKQIADYQKAVKDNPSKGFIFLPIMNIFIKEGSDLSNEKAILSLYNLASECYILTNPINSFFINLFMLDAITANKTIIVNNNSEVCYINNEQAGYLSLEQIDFYLHMRRSTIQKEYYNNQSRDALIETITEKFKDLRGRFLSEYHFDILFTNVNDLNYPITITVKHGSKDKRVIEEWISNTKEGISNMKDITKVFYSIIEVKNLKVEMLEAFDYLNKMLADNGIKSSVNNYQLIIETHNNQLKNKKKSHLLLFSIMKENQDNFPKLLDLCSANLYNNPQIAKLKIGYAIIPYEGIELSLQIKKCKIIKLYKDKHTQMIYENNNKETIFNITTKTILILNPSFVFKDKIESDKVRELLYLLQQWGILFTIVVFSYCEMDSQKLRWLNIDELDDNNNDNADETKNNQSKYKPIDKIYLNSSEIDSYAYFKYYSEDISSKLLMIKDENTFDSFLDIDLINIEIIKQIKNSQCNRNEGLKVLQANSAKSGKYNYKKSKTNIKNSLSKSMMNNKVLALNCQQLTSVIMNVSYKKRITFPNKTTFSSFESNYLGIHLGLIYSDYLEKFLPLEEITKLSQKEGITSLITKLSTKEVLLQNKRICTICQERISTNPLYMCLECNEQIFMCEECYSETKLINHQQYEEDQFFSEFVMNEEDLKKSQTRKWSHCHPLVYCYCNMNISSCRYFLQLYSKYNEKMKKRIEMKRCNFCDDGYIESDSSILNIIISHINNLSISDLSEDSELVICNNCLNNKSFINKCGQDIEMTKNNLLILRIFNTYSK